MASVYIGKFSAHLKSTYGTVATDLMKTMMPTSAMSFSSSFQLSRMRVFCSSVSETAAAAGGGRLLAASSPTVSLLFFGTVLPMSLSTSDCSRPTSLICYASRSGRVKRRTPRPSFAAQPLRLRHSNLILGLALQNHYLKLCRPEQASLLISIFILLFLETKTKQNDLERVEEEKKTMLVKPI